MRFVEYLFPILLKLLYCSRKKNNYTELYESRWSCISRFSTFHQHGYECLLHVRTITELIPPKQKRTTSTINRKRRTDCTDLLDLSCQAFGLPDKFGHHLTLRNGTETMKIDNHAWSVSTLFYHISLQGKLRCSSKDI